MQIICYYYVVHKKSCVLLSVHCCSLSLFTGVCCTCLLCALVWEMEKERNIGEKVKVMVCLLHHSCQNRRLD